MLTDDHWKAPTDKKNLSNFSNFCGHFYLQFFLRLWFSSNFTLSTFTQPIIIHNIWKLVSSECYFSVLKGYMSYVAKNPWLFLQKSSFADVREGP